MIISQTPLRISFCGGGTDLPNYYKRFGGRVLSTAIDKFVYVIINKRYDDRIYIGYSKQEIVNSVDEIEHDLVREASKLVGLTNGFEVKTVADIPSEGSGLGSSSSITVGLLNAFYTYKGIQVPAERLASEACKIEIEILGRPIGKQDQYIAAYGGLNIIDFLPDETVNVTKIINSDIDESNFLLFNTGIQRKSSSILERQNRLLNKNIKLYHSLKELAYQPLSIQKKMFLDWNIKKRLSPNITNYEIETMIETVKISGVNEYKLLGAGGGGFLLVYCEKKYQDQLRFNMKNYRELSFNFEQYGSRIIFNYRR